MHKEQIKYQNTEKFKSIRLYKENVSKYVKDKKLSQRYCWYWTFSILGILIAYLLAAIVYVKYHLTKNEKEEEEKKENKDRESINEYIDLTIGLYSMNLLLCLMLLTNGSAKNIRLCLVYIYAILYILYIYTLYIGL